MPCITAIGLVAALAAPARGQAPADSPVVVSQRPPLELVRIEDLRVAIELSYRHREDRRDSPGVPSTKDTEDLFTETLELSGSSFAGHPNLMHLDFTVRLNLEQEHLDNESIGDSDSRDEFTNEFNLEALFLRESAVPIRAYGRRTEADIDQPFASSIDTTTTAAGFELDFRLPDMPNRIGYEHRDQDQNDRTQQGDFKIVEDSLFSRGDWRISDGNLFNWDYSYRTVDQSGDLRPTNNFDEHDLFAVHLYKFGARDLSSLRSSLTYFKQTGDFAFERLRVDERMLLRHSEDLTSQYDYIFAREEGDLSRQTQHRGQAQVRHQLYDSLYTVATAGASHLEVTEGDFDSDQAFGALDLTYNKLVPYGNIEATYNLNLNYRDDSPTGAPVQVTNEVRTFDVSGLIVLNRRNIDASSIVITDATGVILYSEGVDYTVQNFGDRTEIRRIIGGNIAPGETVLIDYVIGPEPGGETDTVGQGYAFRYNFTEGLLNGFSVYVRYIDVDETRPAATRALFPEADTQEWTYGVEYNLNDLHLLYERQDRNSTLSPFVKSRYEARYNLLLGRDSRFVISADYDDIDNTDDDLRSTILTITARWDQRFTERLRAGVLLQYVMQDDSTGFDSEGFEQQFDLDWHYRQTSISASVRHSSLDSTGTDTDFLTLYVGVRREF